MKILNATLIAIGMFAFATFIHSCKKTDTTNEPIKTEGLSERVKIAFKENPDMRQVILPVNEKVQGHWEDAQGNTITTNNVRNENARVYECAPASDVMYPPGATLVSIGQDYDCNQGYKLTFTYEVSISVNLVSTFNCTASGGVVSTSKGRVRIRNIFNVYTYTDLAIAPTSITNIGEDLSTGNSNVIFRVIYTTQWIPFSLFAASEAASVLSSISMATDCCQLPTFVTTYSSGTISPNTSNPYTRIDPIAITNATLPGTTFAQKAVFVGFGNIVFNNGCPAPPGSSYPERQEIQVLYTGSRPIGSPAPVWTTIHPQLGTYNLAPYGLLNPFVATGTVGAAGDQRGTIGNYDAYYVPDRDLYSYPINTTFFHGNYNVRYRNKKVSTLPFVNGPWSASKAVIL